MVSKKRERSLFSRFAAGEPVILGAHDQKKAREWVRDKALEISSVNVNKVFQSKSGRLVNNVGQDFIGAMLFFRYDPKLKDELPYWDKYPLVFPIEIYPDGFLGINLHYLPPLLRAKLMDALYKTINTKKELNDKSRLNISYQILKNAAKFRAFKPCVKRYLNNHVRSKFFFIEPAQWDVVLMLPLARFQKARQTTVWEDSKNAI